MATEENLQTVTESPSGVNSSNGQTSDENVIKINREFQEKSTMRRAKDLNLPYINIAKTPLNPDFLKVISVEKSELGRMICFFQVGKKLRVAVADPNKAETIQVIEELKNNTFTVDVSLASDEGISEALKIYKGADRYKKIDLVENVDAESISTYEDEIADLNDLPKKISELTAEQGLNLLNIGAMKTQASDIHYEPTEKSVGVRFRIDGVLHKVFELSSELYKTIISQIKYEAKMQLNVVNIPQDGRYNFDFNKKKIGVRVSTIPTPYGESVVCRFLVTPDKALSLEDLGFEGLALIKLKRAAKLSHGMILVTGPTGSGKTTTLYAMLDLMNQPDNKVITLEDPVEYHINGVTQSQINEKQGYNFAAGLRTVLRQDPDIVMLGEIRDLETAQTATQAALTGHALLSTLHTNSAIDVIPRLINMGLPPFMVGPSLNTIVGQRLVRKICSHCAVKQAVSDSEKMEFEGVFKNLKNVNPQMELNLPNEVPKTVGCSKCSNTGYLGRVVIAEVITVNEEMKRLIMNKASRVDLIAAARKEGIITMREDGFIKVAKGLTTLDEVYRVSGVNF